MTVKIKGEIGIDVTSAYISDLMSRISGDVNIEIDSPGGFLSDGISIANALRDYDKGKISVRVVGQASSMAAYIMLFGDTLSFAPNAIVCLHNPWNICIGDYKAMEENADILKRFAALYAKRFVEKGIFEEKEIREIMDAETWFIGADELAKLGTVEKSDADKPDDPVTDEDKETAVILAKERIKTCKTDLQAKYSDDLEKVAALLQQAPAAPRALETSVQKTAGNSTTVQKEKGEKIMDLNEIKTQHPDIFAEIVKTGAESEKSRVNALMTFIDVDKDTVVKAIAEGKSIHDDEILAKLTMAKINQNTIKAMEGDNADPVNPGEPKHADENEAEGGEPELTEEQKAAAEQAKKDAEEKDLNECLALMGLSAK
jgi:ATP-dependent Clp protease protease subunit